MITRFTEGQMGLGYAFEALVEGDVDIFDELLLEPAIDPVIIGSALPPIEGAVYDPVSDTFKTFSADSNINPLDKLIIASPTTFHVTDSPDCAEQAAEFEILSKKLRPKGITVVEFTRQPLEGIRDFVRATGIEHPILRVTENTAQAMGAVIKPLNGATPEYWGDGSEVTARTLTVASSANRTTGRRIVTHRERRADQGSLPNFTGARIAAQRAF